ncbi:MAG: hypothetical protein L0Y58_10080 [Verrucomicrobia subdivision 3 bacterium]|nr:hypothetical protein [Limisphaerales bacterium]
MAIVGGSGAGKTWLSEQLADRLTARSIGRLNSCEDPLVSRVSLDDFYLDRSHLPSDRRQRINYDHPRSIDWRSFYDFLSACREGQRALQPQYDFTSHCRRTDPKWCDPKAVLIVDGLWVVSRRAMRRLFDFIIYVECPEPTRLQRRLERDIAQRNRSEDEIRAQFERTVSPMHERHVAPQKRWANIIVGAPISDTDVEKIADELARAAGLCNSICSVV